MSANKDPAIFSPAAVQCLGKAVPKRRLYLLAGLALLASLLFMTVGLGGNLRYILPHRGLILATMILVAFAASASTLLFQTITHNRILTPSIMGFEALFVLIQTVMIFFGDIPELPHPGVLGNFIGESLLLLLFSALLYRGLLGGYRQDLHLLLLVGIIFGTLFRSAANLMQRLLSPGEFAIVQGRMFATFTRAAPELVAISAVVVLAAAFIIWRARFCFDVLALGRNAAINLGIDYQRQVTLTLLMVSALVAISTALVGPLTFLGFMVTNLSYMIIGSNQHRFMLPAAFLLGVISLVGGQLILAHLLNMAGALSVVIEFIGGALFIVMLVRKSKL